MKKFFSKLLLAVMIALPLSGCLLDAWLLPSAPAADAPPGTPPGPSKIEKVVETAAPFAPQPYGTIATAAAGILSTIYAFIRGKTAVSTAVNQLELWKKAGTVTFDAVEAWLKTHPDHEAEFKEYLGQNHAAAGVYELVKGYVERFDH